jgi:SAM-dependent methyltransferase
VELGCGSHGGFIPALIDAGYQAVGIDPAAPEGASYQRTEFERSALPGEVSAIVACTSLHHVAEPSEVLDKIVSSLVSGGALVVTEWDWERFDERTARWCFERLGPEGSDGWLKHRREEWVDSGLPWERYLRGWAARHGLHSGAAILEELGRRFESVHAARGPYFFPDLSDTTEADELQAINEGRISPTRIDYVGRVR